MRNMKKVMAAALSASMILGMSVPVMAASTDIVDNGSGSSDVTAPIYSLDIVKVVVPSAYEVAFNPGGLDVTTGTGTTSNDQILSRNFGIINQSSKTKIVTVGLKIEDQNTDSPIQFVGSAADVASAEMDDFAIYLEAVPANSTAVQVGTTPAAANETTAAADLKDVTMTKATGVSVPLSAGDNELQFVLGKATYTPIQNSEVTLGTTTGNAVKDNYELTGLAANGKGITAFTLTGSMKETAEWHTLTDGIKITPTYTMETVADDAVTNAVKSGTGAVYENPNPVFTSNAAGVISYTAGTGNDAVQTIKSVTMVGKDGQTSYDGLAARGSSWAAATHDTTNHVITFDTKYIAGFVRDFPTLTEKEATIVYETVGGETKEMKIDLKLK